MENVAEIRQKIIEQYLKIGNSNVLDYVELSTDDNDKPHMELNRNVDGSVIKEITVNAQGNVMIKLYDKMAALDRLGRIIGLNFPEEENTDFAEVSDDELIKLAKFEE